MKYTRLQERYPVFTLEVEKQKTVFSTTDEIIAYLKQCVDGHGVSRFIAVFDHFSHTSGLKNGWIDESILDAKNIIFCFGITLPNPEAMATRPKSIGVVELADRFVITFLEAPMPMANSTMESWVMSIGNPQEVNAVRAGTRI
jgi:hypothetical protein